MATTVLFLHGTAASGRMWAPYAAALGARALTPDLTGTRDRPIPRGEPVDLDADLAIALAAIDGASGLVDLVGHSYGGWLAMRAALARPERVRQVIAHDPTLWGVLSASDDDAITVPFQAMAETSGLLDPEIGGNEAWWRVLLGFWRGPGAWETLSDAQRAGCLRVGWKAFHEVRAVFADPSSPEAWAEVACPVRLTIGEDSPAAVREVAFTLLEHLHQVEVRELPGGHLAPITHPEDCLALWMEWLAA